MAVIELRNLPRDRRVGFGVRHLPAVGNRLLSGKIVAAQVYAKCLSPGQVAASFDHRGGVVSEADLMTMMTDRRKQQLTADRRQRQVLMKQLDALPTVLNDANHEAWTELARAIFLFKEFIYVR